MKAVIIERFGTPSEVLHVQDVPMPEPGRGQARVRMLASPINPSDLLTIRGEYGKRPTLPATPGFEGAGVIDKLGPGLLKHLRGLKVGKRVVVLNPGGGNWQEYVIVSVRNVIPVPDDLSDQQAATFFVNPATVLVMIREVLQVPSGVWLLQTAAGSALGRMVIRLGKHDGFRTINVVRRRELADELVQAGGDAAISTSDESIEERVQAITNGQGVLYAIDAVGGATGAAVVRALGQGGRLLVYGTLAMEPMAIDSRVLIAGTKHVEGFWLSIWSRQQRVLTMLRLFKQIARMMRVGVLTSEIGATFPLDDVRQAVAQAEIPGRHGKVLLTISSRGS